MDLKQLQEQYLLFKNNENINKITLKPQRGSVTSNH